MLNYLYSTKSLAITFSSYSSLHVKVFTYTNYLDNSLGITAYSNAAFTNSKNYKSSFRYLFKIASSTVYYKFIKQKLITTSTTKAKYIALTYTTKEAT
jgi:hypothetical protein